MVHRGFFAYALVLCGAVFAALEARALQTSESFDHGQLRDAIIAHLQGYYAETFGASATLNDIDIIPGNLDPRLALSACTNAPQMRITSPDPMAANVTVKVHCKAPKPWTIYVPVKVSRYVDVLVAARSLARGSVLAGADFSVARMSLSQAGDHYLHDSDEVLGMEVVRSIPLGASIQANALRPPQVIKRGDSVALTAKGGGIAVATRAQALSHGRIGERIRVKNLSSQRIVEAIVSGPGAVTVGPGAY